jgi:hypothetical protein
VLIVKKIESETCVFHWSILGYLYRASRLFGMLVTRGGACTRRLLDETMPVRREQVPIQRGTSVQHFGHKITVQSSYNLILTLPLAQSCFLYVLYSLYNLEKLILITSVYYLE